MAIISLNCVIHYNIKLYLSDIMWVWTATLEHTMYEGHKGKDNVFLCSLKTTGFEFIFGWNQATCLVTTYFIRRTILIPELHTRIMDLAWSLNQWPLAWLRRYIRIILLYRFWNATRWLQQLWVNFDVLPTCFLPPQSISYNFQIKIVDFV